MQTQDTHTSGSETFTIRVGVATKQRLEHLAQSMGRSRSFLAAEALAEYLDTNEWQVAGIKAAVASIKREGAIKHEDVEAWIRSWNTTHESRRWPERF